MYFEKIHQTPLLRTKQASLSTSTSTFIYDAITPSAGTDLFDLALFIREVEELTGFPTDAVSDAQVPAVLADAVREAVPL